ncbi:hypothetical protein [Leptospira levettii]|uniref:hypothetical protein n=1 Tax=Leptospira levettii TaxID=2023178 RepID=UPI001438629F|nr:hypothetical protein [Leptospira levettii]
MKSLRSTANDREKQIKLATDKEKILSSEEGKKLKKAENDAKVALESVEKTVDTAN